MSTDNGSPTTLVALAEAARRLAREHKEPVYLICPPCGLHYAVLDSDSDAAEREQAQAVIRPPEDEL